MHLIGDITDQTNLLALNTTIEAAHGCGFTVVTIIQEININSDKMQKFSTDSQEVEVTINSITDEIQNITHIAEENSQSIYELTNDLSKQLVKFRI